ncbi:DUF2066 domain-containing protein [Neorhizobium sp. IRAMC:178]|uniref:DUF2066 domain-containing protein n=1 Tax=Neorhizobium tunisiense TaxID=3144793 RepID=UPI0031F6EB2A
MHRLAVRIVLIILQVAFPVVGSAGKLEDLYTAKAIVTGQGEKNRQLGFRECLDRVLVRVSGDQRLARRPEMKSLRSRAGSLVQSFSYRDRLGGKPIHDEQGTYDRPHDLTCRYDPAVIDDLLATLRSRPWLEKRPSLAVFLDVQRDGPLFHVSPDDPRDAAMRESFVLGAEPVSMRVVFPPSAHLNTWALGPASPDVNRAVQASGSDLALVGRLVWSDKELGWIATWRLATGKSEHAWTVRGVNFDEAFRAAMRGAAQILSGNGDP